MPVGLLSLLPLHAAGVSGEYHAGTYTAVRYAPNVRTLQRCREAAVTCAAAPPSLLAVDVPDGHGLAPGHHLTYADWETTVVADAWASAGHRLRVTHGCRWEEFRRYAEEYSVWHVVCHGRLRPSATLGSLGALSFADVEVTIDQLRTQIRPAPRRLAILSACRTNVTSSTLPNEAIGLPSALLQLGFAGVIATTWNIDDAATPYLMARFHEIWCEDRLHPAVALNRAQRWMSRATRAALAALLPAAGPIDRGGELPFADPYYWAGFAYTGA